jgi:hypothetical protein
VLFVFGLVDCKPQGLQRSVKRLLRIPQVDNGFRAADAGIVGHAIGVEGDLTGLAGNAPSQSLDRSLHSILSSFFAVTTTLHFTTTAVTTSSRSLSQKRRRGWIITCALAHFYTIFGMISYARAHMKINPDFM